MDQNLILRYSDTELDEFREIIETKLSRATKHLTELQEQIVEITENTSDEHGGDWVDDSSINNDVEMLNNMAIRQRVHIQDLQNALVRIKNKSYGICIITGELIDKRRLLAVPTTTKSMAAKVSEQQQPPEKKIKPALESPEEKKEIEKPIPQKRIITTVIRKSSSGKKKPVEDTDDFDDDLLGVSVPKDTFDDEDPSLLYGDVNDLDDDIADDDSDLDDNDSYDESDGYDDDDDDGNDR
jgi:RNA polymerase-binding transcription factor DksA